MDSTVHLFLIDVWLCFIGLFLTFYVVLDGFDLGIGVLSLFVREEERRGIMMASLGSVWDANETWLVVLGGALFGAFPLFYSVLLNAVAGKRRRARRRAKARCFVGVPDLAEARHHNAAACCADVRRCRDRNRRSIEVGKARWQSASMKRCALLLSIRTSDIARRVISAAAPSRSCMAPAA